jgi:hypothetical protein
MGETPLEATLVVKIHEQMARDFDSVTTITTSGQEESKVGFDTTVSIVKPIHLQYKRPYELESGEIEFGIDERQRNNLADFADNFDKPSVFYAFPLVAGYELLPQTLSRTLFVDIQEITPGSTHVYIPRDFVRGSRITKNHHNENLDTWIDEQRFSKVPKSISYEGV